MTSSTQRKLSSAVLLPQVLCGVRRGSDRNQSHSNKVNLLTVPQSRPCTTWSPGVTLVLKTTDKSLHKNISLALGRMRECLVDKNRGDGTYGPLHWRPEKHNLFHIKQNSSTEPDLWSGSTAFDQTVGKITRPRIGIFIISVSRLINDHHSLPEYRHICVQ